MPTPPLTNDELMEAVNAWRETGNSYMRGAQLLGMNYDRFKNRLDTAKQRGLHLSPGAQSVIARAKLSPVEAKGGWIHDYDADGKKIGTTRWAVEPDGLDEQLDRIRVAFEGITSTPAIPAPSATLGDLCNVLPLYDVHWGMSAWGEETDGPDYDLDLARDDLMRGMEAVLATAPRADTCILILGGDLLHADDNNAQTPASKHPLDVAARMFRVTDTAIAIVKYAVTRALQHHQRVVVRVLRGNHDPNSHRAIAFALREWLASEPRATIDMDPREIFQFQWGRSAIFAQHGDRMKPVDLALKLSDVCPFWSESPHRYAYTGHKHRMAAERIGGLNWERLEPFAPADEYGASWVNRRAMKLDTYHKHRGRIATVLDPLERQ
ncbi:MAG: hypothetical protein RSE12_16880 [Fuscovulum sp.]|nr:MAG: hypothetical protein RSE12_16880 [Fuscovulum sp.]